MPHRLCDGTHVIKEIRVKHQTAEVICADGCVFESTATFDATTNQPTLKTNVFNNNVQSGKIPWHPQAEIVVNGNCGDNS